MFWDRQGKLLGKQRIVAQRNIKLEETLAAVWRSKELYLSQMEPQHGGKMIIHTLSNAIKDAQELDAARAQVQQQGNDKNAP